MSYADLLLTTYYYLYLCIDMLMCLCVRSHGLQQSPAVGRALTELLNYNRFDTIDLDRFGFERVITKTPLFEAEVAIV